MATEIAEAVARNVSSASLVATEVATEANVMAVEEEVTEAEATAKAAVEATEMEIEAVLAVEAKAEKVVLVPDVINSRKAQDQERSSKDCLVFQLTVLPDILVK